MTDAEPAAATPLPAAGAIPFDRIADRYDQVRGGRRRAERLATPILTHLHQGVRTLDIGAGTGTIGEFLIEQGLPTSGIELSQAMARQAASRLRGAAVVADATRLPLADASFDQAVSVWLFHVLPDPLAALSEAARVLRDQGRYVIIPGRTLPPPQPLARTVWDMFARLDPGGTRDDGRHLRLLAPQAGFTVGKELLASRHDVEETPHQVAESIRRRDFPLLWDLPANAWEGEVEPLLSVLDSQPEPDRPRSRTIIHELLVLDRRPRAAAAQQRLGPPAGIKRESS